MILHCIYLSLDQVISGDMLGVHLILDDPAGNSYLQVLLNDTSR